MRKKRADGHGKRRVENVLMLKQIIVEMRFSMMKDRKTILSVLGIGLIFCLVFRDWIMIYVSAASILEYTIQKSVAEGAPEILGFLPMEMKAKHRYVKIKGHFISGIFSLYVLMCMLLSLMPYTDKADREAKIWYALALVFVLFLEGSSKFVIADNAKYRRIKVRFYREFCCPAWYRVLDGICLVLKIVIVCTGFFFWEFQTDFAGQTGFFDWRWKLFIAVTLCVMLVLHICTMRYAVFMVDMGDYNAEKDGGR